MRETDAWEQVEQAADYAAKQLQITPRIGVVLGSGLGAFVDILEDGIAVAYDELPHMPGSSVPGHAGRLCAGTLYGCPVVVMQGRVHLYEGYSAQKVVLGVRIMQRLGAGVLIVTNAAGGIAPGLTAGSLVSIEDHINLTGTSCLLGPNDTRYGPRFPDMTQAYDTELGALAMRVAQARGMRLTRAVYAGVLGPSYETPAEIRMLRAMGAGLVGMSTVQEVIAARHLGMRVLGLSCVTNVAAGGVPDVLLSHDDVRREAALAADGLCGLISDVVRQIPVVGVGA